MFSKEPASGGSGAANTGASKNPPARRDKAPPEKATASAQRPSSAAKPPGNRFQLSTTPARPPTNRFQLSKNSSSSSSASSKKPARPGASAKKPTAPAQRAIAASRGLKRKSATPERVQFSSGSEDSSSDEERSDSDASRKRVKSSVSSTGSSMIHRKSVVLEKAFDSEEPLQSIDFIHGADATSGDVAHKFKAPWDLEEVTTVELQYPTHSQRERFDLKWPRTEGDDYKPMEDIIETICTIAATYFPPALRDKHTHTDTGFRRRFNRAWLRQSIPEFVSIISDFNAILTPLVESGATRLALASRPLDPETVRRVLDQTYARTVSPKVETLRAYQNGSDYVYGELLTRFCSDIFRQTALTENQTIVDLGSGVGNVVLQAALETGAESWGIELMKNPSDLAAAQAVEFPARTHLWGLSPGPIHLLRGDFTSHPEINAVLQRVDVVLVNNQAFTPALNAQLRDMFLDLKTGCRVVSLKPFVPEGHRITLRNLDSVANLFTQRRLEYFSGSVSWTDHSGFYYIATKDPGPLERFTKGLETGGGG